MDLAKPCLDVGLYTNRVEEMRAFYEGTVGLRYEELLKAGRGVHQHRLGLHGAVLKLNASREPLEESPSCLRGLVLPGATDAELADPDGLPLAMATTAQGVAVRWASTDPGRLGRLLADGFGAEPAGEARWRIGRTELRLVHDPVASSGPLRHRGFRYLTVQVRDVRAEHARLLEVGFTEATAPVRLGDVAFISFVRDPDGAWIEVSQRASLTGPLPEA